MKNIFISSFVYFVLFVSHSLGQSNCTLYSNSSLREYKVGNLTFSLPNELLKSKQSSNAKSSLMSFEDSQNKIAVNINIVKNNWQEKKYSQSQTNAASIRDYIALVLQFQQPKLKDWKTDPWLEYPYSESSYDIIFPSFDYSKVTIGANAGHYAYFYFKGDGERMVACVFSYCLNSNEIVTAYISFPISQNCPNWRTLFASFHQ